ncbi:hypothetical protein [Dongia sp.]|uniref:hypothetical protein n=1 Tax=Dongia sp. TaxID=1977262 RepID=UPI003751F95B
MIADDVIGQPDRPNRTVLLAVELIDPVARSLVSRGVEVTAVGLSSRPIVNASGRFVWLTEGQAWPQRIVVTPTTAPYAAQIAAPPVLPERLRSIFLRPARDYEPVDGITGLRGRLKATAADDAPPIVGARVQLAWSDHKGNFRPLKPKPESAGADDPDAPSPAEVQTDANGEFIALLRPPGLGPKIVNGEITVRLQFTRGREVPVTKFSAAHIVREGRLSAKPLTLSWANLDDPI